MTLFAIGQVNAPARAAMRGNQHQSESKVETAEGRLDMTGSGPASHPKGWPQAWGRHGQLAKRGYLQYCTVMRARIAFWTSHAMHRRPTLKSAITMVCPGIDWESLGDSLS